MPIRPHGRGWEVRVQHAYGRPSKTFRHYRDAQEYERALVRRINDHRVGRTPRYSLNEALERWLLTDAKPLKSYVDLKNKVRIMYPHVRGKHLNEVAEVAEAVKSAGLAQKLTPATINRRLAILRRVARLAHRRWAWLDTDAASRITLLPGEIARRQQATPQQVKALMLAARPRTRKAIIWAALTGLRRAELQQVTPESFRGRAIVLLETKTGRPRIVPLAAGLNPKAFPFGLTDSELSRDFRAARMAAGMDWLQFRDLRRTCGSWIVQRTGSLKAAQDLLGHSTITVTAKHYAHLLDDHLRAAVATLPRLAGLRRGRKRVRK